MKKWLSRQSSLLPLELIFTLLLLANNGRPSRAQTINTRRKVCLPIDPDGPALLGYTSIEDIEFDQELELGRLRAQEATTTTAAGTADSATTLSGPYTFTICPNTVIDVSITPLHVELKNSIFQCGSLGLSESNCTIMNSGSSESSGKTTQVVIDNVISNSDNSESSSSIQFKGITFTEFTGTSIYISVPATDDVAVATIDNPKIIFEDVIWQNFPNAASILHMRHSMQVTIKNSIISSGIGSSTLFSNSGGYLSLEDVDFIDIVTEEALITTSNGGNSNLIYSYITLSSIETITFTNEGSLQTISDVSISRMHAFGAVLFSVEDRDSVLSMHKIDISKNDRMDQPLDIYSVVIAGNSGYARIADVSVSSNTGVKHVFSSQRNATVEVSNSEILNTVGAMEGGKIISGIFHATNFGRIISKNNIMRENINFTAAYFSIYASHVDVQSSCITGGSGGIAAFIGGNASFTSASNFIDSNHSTLACQSQNARMLKESGTGCFVTGLCSGSCQQFASETACLANVAPTISPSSVPSRINTPAPLPLVMTTFDSPPLPPIAASEPTSDISTFSVTHSPTIDHAPTLSPMNEIVATNNSFIETTSPQLATPSTESAIYTIIVGTIEMTHDKDDDNYFCFRLEPRPSMDIDVTCISSRDEITCCNGGNMWNFRPSTEMKCGGLTAVSIADYPVTVTCSAVGYMNGSIILGQEPYSPSNTTEQSTQSSVLESEEGFSPSDLNSTEVNMTEPQKAQPTTSIFSSSPDLNTSHSWAATYVATLSPSVSPPTPVTIGISTKNETAHVSEGSPNTTPTTFSPTTRPPNSIFSETSSPMVTATSSQTTESSKESLNIVISYNPFINSLAKDCPMPDNTAGTFRGYSSIADINRDQQAELNRIVQGTNTTSGPYLFRLCPNTEYNASVIPLQVFLKNTVFMCGPLGSSKYGCTINGGNPQVIIENSRNPAYFENGGSIHFVGIEFSQFFGVSVKASISNDNVIAVFEDVTWTNFRTADSIVELSTMKVSVQQARIVNGIGGTLFSNRGGQLIVEGLATINIIAQGLIFTSIGGTSFLTSSEISSSSLQSITETNSRATQRLTGVVISHNSLGSVFLVKDHLSYLVIENVDIINNLASDKESAYSIVRARNYSDATVIATTIMNNTGIEHAFSAAENSTLTVSSSNVKQNLAFSGSDIISSIIFSILGGKIISRSNIMADNIGFLGTYFSIFGGHMDIITSCIIGGNGDFAAFVGSDATFTIRKNHVDRVHSTTLCNTRGQRMFVESGTGCFVGSSCNGRCVQFATEEDCMAGGSDSSTMRPSTTALPPSMSFSPSESYLTQSPSKSPPSPNLKPKVSSPSQQPTSSAETLTLSKPHSTPSELPQTPPNTFSTAPLPQAKAPQASFYITLDPTLSPSQTPKSSPKDESPTTVFFVAQETASSSWRLEGRKAHVFNIVATSMLSLAVVLDYFEFSFDIL